jgi:hypothetical protein
VVKIPKNHKIAFFVTERREKTRLSRNTAIITIGNARKRNSNSLQTLFEELVIKVGLLYIFCIKNNNQLSNAVIDEKFLSLSTLSLLVKTAMQKKPAPIAIRWSVEKAAKWQLEKRWKAGCSFDPRQQATL